MVTPRITALDLFYADVPFVPLTWTQLVDTIDKPLCIMRLTNTSDVDIYICYENGPVFFEQEIVPAGSSIELNFQNNAPHSTDACFAAGKPIHFKASNIGKGGGIYFSGYTYVK